MNRILLFVTVLFACGLIAAGCGGDDDNGGDDSVATTETAPATPTETDPGDEVSGDSAEECMEHVEAQIDLHEQIESETPADFRSQLEATCDDVTNAQDLVVALRDQCKVIAEETLPGDAVALEACEDIKQP